MLLEIFRRYNNGADDWYADGDVPSGWPVGGPEWWVRFSYYDTSMRLDERERALDDNEMGYDCVVTLIHDYEDGHDEFELGRFAAPWAEAAEEWLNKAAYALYGDIDEHDKSEWASLEVGGGCPICGSQSWMFDGSDSSDMTLDGGEFVEHYRCYECGSKWYVASKMSWDSREVGMADVPNVRIRGEW